MLSREREEIVPPLMKRCNIIFPVVFILYVFHVWLHSYLLSGTNLKWCVLDFSPLWFEKIEIIVYDKNLVYIAIGMPEVELALLDDQMLSLCVGKEPIGIVTYTPLSQGYHYYSLDKRAFVDAMSLKHEYVNYPQWVSLPTMCRSTYFTRVRDVYEALEEL